MSMKTTVPMLTVLVLLGCGTDNEKNKKNGGNSGPPTPAERVCGLIEDVVTSCESASACDLALVDDCAGVAGLLSEPLLIAAADCIDGGMAPLDCLVSAVETLAPTASHEAFAEQFCSECLFGLPGCESSFYGGDDSDDAGLAGALILPLGDELVDAIASECASGLSCATFPTCAQGVLAGQAIPEATLGCILDSFTGTLPTEESGDCGS